MKLNDAQRAGFEEAWRLFPHTYANVASKGRWKPYRHLTHLSAKMYPGLVRGGGRYIVTMPPRHGKSEFISHWLPTWFLDAWPDRRVGLASYSAQFSKKWGRKVRKEFETNPFVKNKLNADASASNYFEVENGAGEENGFMMTAGVEGPFTGEGFNLIIVDDPIKNFRDAASDTKRQTVKDWWQAVAETRLEPHCTVIILMTRWHEDDLVGWLLECMKAEEDDDVPPELKDDWEIINLPAVAEEDDPLGREPGEALCPERYNEIALKKRERRIGARFWNALFQQRPSAAEGEILKREYWQYYDTLPKDLDEIIHSWDLRFKDNKEKKKDKGDYVVGQIWGRKGAHYYLIDQVRDKWGYKDSKTQLIMLAQAYPKAYLKLIENKANGPALESDLKNSMTGIRLVEPGGSKFARVSACEVPISTGHVHIPRPERYRWVPDFIEECAAFSENDTHKHDDQVDAMTQAILYFEDKTNSALLKLINT